MTRTESMLDRIVMNTLEALKRRMELKPLTSIEARSLLVSPSRNFIACLKQDAISIIAEVKRASPSKGWLSPSLNAAKQSQAYVNGGAVAVSVLTEPDFFHGSLADMQAVSQAVNIPVLCKGFVVDKYQLYEARLYGADAVLLITSILDDVILGEFIQICHSLGMAALVEVHDEQELDKALNAGARIVGINNRNLADFTVDLNTTLKLKPRVPGSVITVSESGIATRSDIEVVEKAGVDAVLIGEILVRAVDPAATIRELLGR